jgi:hypothetical protein
MPGPVTLATAAAFRAAALAGCTGAEAPAPAPGSTAASGCQQEAEVRGKWLRTRIKESSPQVLATG